MSGKGNFIGILPAAGTASRLRPFRYPKELLPIVFAPDPPRGLRPVLAIEYALRAMGAAEIERCLVVIADWKTEVVRLLGDGQELGMRLAYLHRDVPRGLADAVDAGYPWFGDHSVCLALPDTIFRPLSALKALKDELTATGADVVLGVFPTHQPQQLGPVRADEDGRVLAVFEKPPQTDLRNTWGIAAWSPRFSRFLHERLSATGVPDDLSLGPVFHEAVREGLAVRAVTFVGGAYCDVGKAENIASLLLNDEPDRG